MTHRFQKKCGGPFRGRVKGRREGPADLRGSLPAGRKRNATGAQQRAGLTTTGGQGSDGAALSRRALVLVSISLHKAKNLFSHRKTDFSAGSELKNKVVVLHCFPAEPRRGPAFVFSKEAFDFLKESFRCHHDGVYNRFLPINQEESGSFWQKSFFIKNPRMI